MGKESAILTVSVKVTVTVLSLSRLQSSSETLPGTLVLPEGQLLQYAEPVDTANLPGSHLSQEAAPNTGATVPDAQLGTT